MNSILILEIFGVILTLLPIILIPLKIKAGISKYIAFYIFLFLFYLFSVFYTLSSNNYILIFVYVFQMLFFLNLYKAYLERELFLAIPMVVVLINALAVLFTFYFITFNLFELLRDIIKKKKTSPLVLSSTIFFEGGVIIQLIQIVFGHTYMHVWSMTLFVIGTLLFIIPGLRVAYEKEEI